MENSWRNARLIVDCDGCELDLDRYRAAQGPGAGEMTSYQPKYDPTSL